MADVDYSREQQGDILMKTHILLLALTSALQLTSSHAADHDPKSIITLLKDSKMSLLEGIDYAERSSGPATSAKFEVDGGRLILSVYTIPEGLEIEPEKATLTELGGVATESPFKPNTKVFADKEHIARASVHMTLFQLSPYSLKQVIQRALMRQPGTPIDVRNPMVRNQRPVADVIIVDFTLGVHTATVDLLNGKTTVVDSQ
jgi:hypothetical protein